MRIIDYHAGAAGVPGDNPERRQKARLRGRQVAALSPEPTDARVGFRGRGVDVEAIEETGEALEEEDEDETMEDAEEAPPALQ